MAGPRTRRCVSPGLLEVRVEGLWLAPGPGGIQLYLLPPLPPPLRLGHLTTLSRGRSIITFLLAQSSSVSLFSSQNRLFFIFLIFNFCFYECPLFLFKSERRLLLLITRTFSLSW